MAHAVRVIRKPDDPEGIYVLFTNGRFLVPPGSSALPIEQVDWTVHVGQSAGSRNAPTFYGWVPGNTPNVVVAAVITSWTPVPSGCVLDVYGSLYPFGDFDDVPGVADMTNVPWKTFPLPLYADLVMAPDAGGTGYLLRGNAERTSVGTGVTVIDSAVLTDFFTGTRHTSIRLIMEWATKKHYVVDVFGRAFTGNSATAIQWRDYFNDAKVYPALTKFFPNIATMHVVDWTTGAAWLFHTNGAVGRGNDAEKIFGNHYHPGRHGLFLDHAVLDDGTAPEVPFRAVHLTHIGSLHEFISSTPPVLSSDGRPADPTTDTTRPEIGFEYADQQDDALIRSEVAVFTDAQYLAGGFDPTPSPAVFRATSTDEPWRRSFTPPVDLVNDTYRAYFRGTDAAGQTSAWAFGEWVQNVTPLNAPSIVATPLGALAGVQVVVDGNADLLPIDGRLALQYRDDPAAEWEFVRDGHELVPDPVTANAIVVDSEARYGAARTYRAFGYDPAPWRASPFSSEDTATITERRWTLVNVFDPNQGGQISVREGVSMEPEGIAGVFHPDGKKYPTIVRGTLRAATGTLPLRSLDAATREMIEGLIEANTTLLLRDPLGRAWYVEIIGKIPNPTLRLAPTPSEATPIRDAHEWELPLTEVERPTVGVLAPELVGVA